VNPTTQQPLRLGTRKSLLALTQSQWVAHELERAHPGLQVSLVPMETKGDQLVDIPLREAEGREFFVKELDEALLSDQVDLTVHSFKDLSLERPNGIRLGAVPKRENPRDVIIFSKTSLQRLKKGEQEFLLVGTSSPRRLEILQSTGGELFPFHSALKWQEIRGNVPTRLNRLKEPLGASRRMDAVVLALAGLNRLWATPNSRKELAPLLEGTEKILLPLSLCPGAPGQGALAVECAKPEVHSLLKAIHCDHTYQAVQEERKILQVHGGGCHQRFGATQVEHPRLGPFLHIGGKNLQGRELDDFRWRRPNTSPRSPSWNGHAVTCKNELIDLYAQGLSPSVHQALSRCEHLFISHTRALTPSFEAWLRENPRRIWVPGLGTWKKLIRRGILVEGCTEGWGISYFQGGKLDSLQLSPLDTWVTLTHDAASGPHLGEVIATYRSQEKMKSDDLAEESSFLGAEEIFWASASQFKALSPLLSKDLNQVQHCCGPGKTVEALEEAGLRPLVFPNPEEWQKWRI